MTNKLCSNKLLLNSFCFKLTSSTVYIVNLIEISFKNSGYDLLKPNLSYEPYDYNLPDGLNY